MKITGRVRCPVPDPSPHGHEKRGQRGSTVPFFMPHPAIKRDRDLFGRFSRRPGAARALARRFLDRLGIIVGAPDRGRQHGEVQTALFLILDRRLAGTAAAGAGRLGGFGLGFRSRLRGGDRLGRGLPFGGRFGPGLFHSFLGHRFLYRRTLATAVVPVIAIIPIVALIAVAPVAVVPALTIVARFVTAALEILPAIGGLIGANVLAAFIARVEIVEIIVEALIAGAEALLLLLLPGAVVGQDAEIMVGKLQIIFRIHPIARHLGVARHIPVFFKKLGRIAARAVVNPVAIVATAPIATIGTTTIVVPAAIPATGLPVVDQELILAFTLPSFTENTVQSPSSKLSLNSQAG